MLRRLDIERHKSGDLVVALLTEPGNRDSRLSATEVEVVDRLQISPNDENWARRVSTQILIVNRSKNYIWVDRIKPSCGCARVLTQPALLLPGERGVLEIEVNPISWGPGHRIKQIPISFGGGSFEASILLEGEFIKSSATGLNPITETAKVSIPLEWTDKVFEKQVRFPVSQLPENARATVTDGNWWCNAEVDDRDRSILVSLAISPQALGRVRLGESLRCRIELSAGTLMSTYIVVVEQDFSCLMMTDRTVRLNEHGFQFSGQLLSQPPNNWNGRLKSTSNVSLKADSEWSITSNGDWQLSGHVDPPITRPMPVTLNFYHPQYMSVSLNAVLIPDSGGNQSRLSPQQYHPSTK